MRKVDHARAHPDNTFHTVVRDERDVYEGGAYREHYSGHSLYYKRGSSRWSLSSMYKVRDEMELRRLLDLPAEELPELARGDLPSGPALEKLREQAARASDSRKLRDSIRKEKNRDRLNEQARVRRARVASGA